MKRKKTINWPEFIWTAMAALWLALFPLWQDGSYTRITRAKWTGMLVFTGICILTAIVTGIAMGKRRTPFRPRVFTLSHYFAAAYFFWVLLSALFGSWADSLNDQGQPAVWFGALRYEGCITQLCYGIIFLVMSLSSVRQKPWLDAVAVSLILYCIIVALQYNGANPLGLFPGDLRFPTFFEFQGTMGNTNMVSAYLSLVVPLLAMGYVQNGRIFWLAACLPGSLLMACLEVQSGMIALGFLLVLLAAILLHDPQIRPRAVYAITGILSALLLRQAICLPWIDSGDTGIRILKLLPVLMVIAAGYGIHRLAVRWHGGWHASWILLAVLFAALAMLIAVTFLPVPKEAGGLWELHEVLLGRPQDQFGTWRLGLWRYTLDLSRESPVFGTGPDTFYYAMAAYMHHHRIHLTEVYDTPHNILLGILSGSGWPALILFLGLLFTALRNAWRHSSQPGMLACGAAICCYMVQGLFTFSICFVSPMFFALLGMVCCQAGETTGRK